MNSGEIIYNLLLQIISLQIFQCEIMRNQLQSRQSDSRHSNYFFSAAFITEAIQRQTKRYQSSYSNPASIQLAKKHQKATKFGYIPPPKEQNRKKALIEQKEARCGCCNFSSNNEEIQLLHRIEPSKDKQYKLTQDVALFFTFIKSLVLFVILHTVTHAAFNIISSDIGGHYCDRLEACPKQIWNKTSISNKYDRHDLITVVDALDLVAVLASIVYLGWSRRFFYKVSQNIDEFSVSQGQFTLFLRNLPTIEYPEVKQNIQDLESSFRERLKQYMYNIVAEGIRSGQLKRQDISFQYLLHSSGNRQARSKNIITSISLCYNLSDYEVLHNQKWNLIGQFENNFVLLDFCGFKLPDLFGFKHSINLQGSLGNQLIPQTKPKINFKKRIQTNLNQEVMFNLLDMQKRNQLNEIRKKVSFINESQINVSYELVRNKKLYFHNTTFSGNVFVSFQFEDFKDYIYQKYLADPKQFVFDGVEIKIQQACDPTDVYWLNMRISESTRQNRILFSYIVLVMLLVCSFMILFSVEILKRNYVEDKEGGILSFAKTQTLSLITSLLILGANSLFDFVSWFLTNMQGHVTKTNYLFSQLIKSFFSRLINTVFMYFMISVILNKDYKQQKFISSTGLVTQIYNFIVVSGLLNLISAFINTDDLWARLKRWYIYSVRQNGDEVFTKFQVTLNQQFELPQFNLVNRYGDYLVTLYTALFYAYLVPIGVPTLIIIFSVQYWIDKFSLFKRCSLKNHFSYNLSIYVRRIFESSILMFALGNFIFSYYLQDQKFGVLNIISLFIAAIFTVCVWIAPQKIQRKLFGKYEILDTISYSQCENQQRFRTTYWNQNPATFCVDQHLQNSKRLMISNSHNRDKKNRQQNPPMNVIQFQE